MLKNREKTRIYSNNVIFVTIPADPAGLLPAPPPQPEIIKQGKILNTSFHPTSNFKPEAEHFLPQLRPFRSPDPIQQGCGFAGTPHVTTCQVTTVHIHLCIHNIYSVEYAREKGCHSEYSAVLSTRRDSIQHLASFDIFLLSFVPEMNEAEGFDDTRHRFTHDGLGGPHLCQLPPTTGRYR